MNITTNGMIFFTEHNKYPDFNTTLSHMRGHHPRGHELHDLSLRGKTAQLYYKGVFDKRKNPVEDEAMKVIAELKKGNEVYIDGNRLMELVEYLETNESAIKAKEGAAIFDKLNVVVEPPTPTPILTKDLHYAKTVAGMWNANRELEQRKAV